MAENLKNFFKGFSKLELKDRLERLVQIGVLSPEDLDSLKASSGPSIDLAEKFIENAIGYFQIPLGVATHFKVDEKEYVIPMAVEETSIIAAASKTAKWISEAGKISTQILGKEIIGQIQIAKVANFENLNSKVIENKKYLINLANNEVASGLVRRGGGVRDITVRKVPRGETDSQDNQNLMAVIHVMMDPCDAMGANIMNQVCEFLKHPIEKLAGEKVTMCILSNLVDSKLTQARVVIYNIDQELGYKIQEASLFALQNPYRAATNNKGVLNGIDPILIATGNDWRAVEAGVHAYAARDGQYRSITRWQMIGKDLVGIFEAPLITGLVGGVTQLHPTAKTCLRMLAVESAEELSRVCAAVGLVQNLGALRALTTVGIIEGHMKPHIRNLTLGAGAEEKEIPIVQKKLEQILALRKRISLSNAVEVLRELRGHSSTPSEAERTI